MTTRTRKATTSPAPATPAKKTAAKKTARAPRKTTAKKTQTRLSLVKPEPATAPAMEDHRTVVDLRYRLTVRRRLFVGPMGTAEQAAVRAALASATLRLPVPVRAWNGSTAQLGDGTLLIHNPGPDRRFTAHIACRHGAIHGWPITSYADLVVARDITRSCERPHGGVNADQAITCGVSTIPPKTTPVLVVHDGLRRTADTQPLTEADITDGLATRTADTETPKEHPQP